MTGPEPYWETNEWDFVLVDRVRQFFPLCNAKSKNPLDLAIQHNAASHRQVSMFMLDARLYCREK
jgi:hypothetical protein